MRLSLFTLSPVVYNITRIHDRSTKNLKERSELRIAGGAGRYNHYRKMAVRCYHCRASLKVPVPLVDPLGSLIQRIERSRVCNWRCALMNGRCATAVVRIGACVR